MIDEGRLVLHGLKQYHINVIEEKKFKKLIHILDTLPFNQAIVFVNRVDRAKMLHSLLHKEMFNPICLHSALEQHERIQTFEDFRDNKSTLLIATDLVGRGIDI